MFTTLFTLGRDADLRYTQNNKAVLNCALAYNYGMKDQATGKKPTQWLEATLWGQSAESLAPYLLKGTKIVASIKDLHIETYDKNDNTLGVKLVGTIQEVLLAGSPQGQQQAAPQQQQSAPRQQAPARQQAPQRQQHAPAAGGGIDDDDIPFNQLPARYDI